jgi:predicted nucleic acid-binding Zn ribbon protein
VRVEGEISLGGKTQIVFKGCGFNSLDKRKARGRDAKSFSFKSFCFIYFI